MCSNSKNPKKLAQAEVNHKILEKVVFTRFPEELLEVGNLYHEDHISNYNKKKDQFLEDSKIYNKINEDPYFHTKLQETYLKELKLEFLKCVCEKECVCGNDKKFDGDKATIRNRSERKAHEVPVFGEKVCSVEPWLRRYLILNKFIMAGRKIIIKNRLLRVLEVFKQLDEEKLFRLEKERKVWNVSYKEVFQKFMK